MKHLVQNIGRQETEGRDMPITELAGMLAVLEHGTGQPFDAASFDSRLRIQKSVYVLKVLGFAPAARYSFNDYFHGPYSPDLAKDYYALLSMRLLGQSPETIPVEIPEHMLRIIAGAVHQGNNFLEAVTTIHSIAAHDSSLDRGQIRCFFRSRKPLIADRFEEGWAFLVANHLIGERT